MRMADGQRAWSTALMTLDETAAAIAKKGLTERQARFLTTVMLHSPAHPLNHCSRGEPSSNLLIKLPPPSACRCIGTSI